MKVKELRAKLAELGPEHDESEVMIEFIDDAGWHYATKLLRLVPDVVRDAPWLSLVGDQTEAA